MKFIHNEIGTASDNTKAPVHNWYKFTAGFSHKLIDELIIQNKLKGSSRIYEPFAGCGTTLIQAQKKQIQAVGNEGQSFMCEVIQAKLNWGLDRTATNNQLGQLKQYVLDKLPTADLSDAHPLLKSLYLSENLKCLYLLKEAIGQLRDPYQQLFFKLALSQSLHKCSINPISVPYIARSTFLERTHDSLSLFCQIAASMLNDLVLLDKLDQTSQIYLHDSRTKNVLIADNQCDICITSPPYLNNLDYGEVSKVHTHFYEMTTSWQDITKQVRSSLVTASTTHYANSAFNIDEWKKREFYQVNQRLATTLLEYSAQVKHIRQIRKGSKSFDIMLLLYFEDMYHVLKEIRRVLAPNKKIYMVVGDSAPYGVFIPTTDILGEISQSVGFAKFKKYKIRVRGTKWTSLTHRHNLSLDENIIQCC